MSRHAKAPAGGETAEVDQMAERLAGRLERGKPPLVYCRGSLAELCGLFPGAHKPLQGAWRRVRGAAMAAQEDGRAILVQRRVGDITEYLAVGLEGR